MKLDGAALLAADLPLTNFPTLLIYLWRTVSQPKLMFNRNEKWGLAPFYDGKFLYKVQYQAEFFFVLTTSL